MQTYDSYTDAFKAALSSQTFSIAHLQHVKLPLNIDISGCCKLFFFLSGAKQFHIDQYIYDIQPGDLFFINQREFHYFPKILGDSHERFVAFIHPDFLKKLSTGKTDLFSCFSHKEPHPVHRLQLQQEDRDKVLHLLHKLTSVDGFGEDILTTSHFLELVVFLSGLYLKHQADHPRKRLPEPTAGRCVQIHPIAAYIDEHITQDLSLEILSQQFYLTPSYLCRIFKNGTGTTIHKYITAKRITLAKDLLTQGFSVTDACSLSGFKDYNGFFKSFVSAVGISPKKYAQFGEP